MPYVPTTFPSSHIPGCLLPSLSWRCFVVAWLLFFAFCCLCYVFVVVVVVVVVVDVVVVVVVVVVVAVGLAYVGIYVDAVLVVSDDNILKEIMQQLTTIFQMSPYDQVSFEHPVTFCGYEIYKEKNGYGLRQEKYIEELLSKREVEKTQPLPKIQEGEDEEYHDPKVVKEVQAIVGELQWLATRTRPGLPYSTAFAARLVHRRPAYALRLCHYMLRSLAKYPKLGLSYELRTKLLVWGICHQQIWWSPIGFQGFVCSGHQHQSRSMQFTLWGDLICYMIETCRRASQDAQVPCSF